MIRRIAPLLALAVFAAPSFAEDAATVEKTCAQKECPFAGTECASKECANTECAGTECAGTECASKECANTECAGTECASTECASKDCPIEAAMAKLPKLTYSVGTEETCCPESAAKLAKEHDDAVKYVLAKKAFGTEAEATLALAEATEKFVNEFTTPSKCEVSGKVTVAGKQHCCEAMAGERAELVRKAMDTVNMTYLVGNEECACPNKAAALAKQTGKDKLFVVSGEKTCCDVSARLKLARAKYKAAIEALAKVDGPAQGQESQPTIQ